jgi:uncharacterized protein DUF4124
MTRFALIALSLLAAGSAQAQVYKCVDAAGRVVYSQIPCPASTKSGTITRRIDAAPYTGSTAPSAESAEKADKAGAAKAGSAKAGAPKTPAEQEQAFRKRAQEREKSAKDADQKAAEAKRKEENCRTARERLAQAETGRVRRITPEGERYYLDDAQLEQQRAAGRTEVAQFCN